MRVLSLKIDDSEPTGGFKKGGRSPVSMSSPRSNPEKSRLAFPPGPCSASSRFSMRICLALRKLNRLVHSFFWIPRNRNSCRALSFARVSEVR
jgi:hypothetical protein